MMGHAKRRRDWIVLDRLADVVLSNVEGCVLDVGVGVSTLVLADHAKRFDRVQYSCDKKPLIIERYGLPLHERHEVVCSDGLEWLQGFEEKVALALLDGCHKSEVVSHEVNLLLSIMDPGAVVFIHDTYPPERLVRESGRRCGDVYKVRQWLEGRRSVQTWTWPYLNQAQGCGLTMVMKKYADVPECQR